MVRAKVVDHPKDWPFCGYHELTKKRFRYCLIDKSKLRELLRINHPDELKRIYEGWVEQSLSSGKLQRESIWTESIAVGDRDFVEHIEMRLGMKVKYREIEEKEGGFVLKEAWEKY